MFKQYISILAHINDETCNTHESNVILNKYSCLMYLNYTNYFCGNYLHIELLNNKLKMNSLFP